MPSIIERRLSWNQKSIYGGTATTRIPGLSVREDEDMTETGPAAVRREVGDFLRSRRERVTPQQVGLPSTGRRRTPGLRREEVAVLAGVGVTWYTWLEQGRPINVSTHVLQAVARALQLDDTERRHLHQLAGSSTPKAQPSAECDPGLIAAFQPVLDKLDPFPACLQTPLFDVVAYNRAYRFLFTDMDLIPPDERNCAVQFFTDPDWRSRYVDVDLVAARMVARLRAEVGADIGAPAAGGIVDDLRERSEDFARLWARHDVLPRQYETKRLDSPLVGQLRLNFVSTDVPETGHRMTVMTPADESTSLRLTQMAGLTAATTRA
ncbi:helix-turn-helix transcriptional regulator [Streptomyces sp. BB1-1-1]|uniref:helix-turn-helix transcriptional regulator n=1 Tax=Streptomyces sp. BB1-1-1 TaxID=3074430 RepID=UPI002877EE7C|nr:helix-turn-helix transcriptional regulator [Streptomyces sp. BB1-1-1]WND39853.1 helix-turn-helix transcriptional regulator [Streptomyces sp. BB1-1-1]